MSITYEDALSTLEAMFGTTWTKDELGELLRHQKGHMERTCEVSERVVQAKETSKQKQSKPREGRKRESKKQMPTKYSEPNTVH